MEERDLIAEKEIGTAMPGVITVIDENGQAATPTPKKRGRPLGSKNKATKKADELDMTAETLQGMLDGIFLILAARQPHWALSPAESKMLTEVTYKFLLAISDKIGKFVGIGTLITVWGVILIPRIVKSKQLQSIAEPEEAVHVTA